MYNNIGKRDILIFPEFDNINIIDDIRNKYDRLAKLVKPHITLVFPFNDEITNEDLINKLSELLKNHSPFEVIFKGVSLNNDNYILLNCIKGSDNLIKLHYDIYKNILPHKFNKSINYTPHITLGQASNLDNFNDFNTEFKTLVTELSIELIGENEESIIIQNITLENKCKNNI